MKIAVIGLGFVGLVTAVVLADNNNEVIGIDIDENKIKKLKNGELYIYEPNLKELFIKNKHNLKFYSDYNHIKRSEVAFICVPTPTINNKIELSYVRDSVLSVNEIDKDIIIVIKSTVVPGTAKSISSLINRDIISNPEFLREGSAIKDTIHPDRIVIGGKNKEYINKVESVWKFTKAPVIKTTNENAELIKYASNAFLAVKISYINEIANLCEKIPNTDVNIIAEGMGLDHRIGKEFLRAGIGFGGSCLPKDTKAIVTYAKEKGIDLSIIEASIKVNNERVKHAIKLIKSAIGNIKNKKICLLGLTFKENTNDLRESKSVELALALKKSGAIVYAYDPIIKEADEIKDKINIIDNLNNCRDYDCIVISSEWKDFESNECYKTAKNIIDLRRVVNLDNYPNIKAIGVGYAKN